MYEKPNDLLATLLNLVTAEVLTYFLIAGATTKKFLITTPTVSSQAILNVSPLISSFPALENGMSLFFLVMRL